MLVPPRSTPGLTLKGKAAGRARQGVCECGGRGETLLAGELGAREPMAQPYIHCWRITFDQTRPDQTRSDQTSRVSICTDEHHPALTAYTCSWSSQWLRWHQTWAKP